MDLSAQLVRFEDLRSASAGTIAGAASYHAVGAVFANPARILKITNLTDANLIISFDGVADKDIVAAQSYCLYDYCSDKTDQAGTLEQQANTNRVYVRYESTLPTTGNVYVTLIYASTQ